MTMMWVGRSVLVRAFWFTLLVALVLAGSGCQTDLVIRGEEPHPNIRHYVAVTYKGERLKGHNGGNRELLFSADPEDFGLAWQRWLANADAVGDKVPAYYLIPWFDVGVGSLNLVLDEPLCLSGPIQFFDSGTLEQVWEIPAGTCLENGGKTAIVIDD